jgi:uncharacterized protein
VTAVTACDARAGFAIVKIVELLHPVEVRVLGSLLEKDITTPEYYPMTVNALVNACNQKSSRDPVVQYDEETVLQALSVLQHKGLVTRVSGAGHRVEKFGHRLGERLNLGRREQALLCVLMLRGPQTVGELRSRTDRMHEFEDLDEVERVLDAMAGRETEPLVVRMPRGRWGHLLSGTPEAVVEAPDAVPMPDRAALLDRVASLEREVEQLKQQFQVFRKQFE